MMKRSLSAQAARDVANQAYEHFSVVAAEKARLVNVAPSKRGDIDQRYEAALKAYYAAEAASAEADDADA